MANQYWYQYIGKSITMVEINMWKLWPSKIYKCIGKRLAVIDNQYFTNCYQYIITWVACVTIFNWFYKWSAYNESNSKVEFFLTETFKEISCYNAESWKNVYFDPRRYIKREIKEIKQVYGIH